MFQLVQKHVCTSPKRLQERKTKRNLAGDILFFFWKSWIQTRKIQGWIVKLSSVLRIKAQEKTLSLSSGAFPKLSRLLCRATNKRSIVWICKLCDVIETQAPIGITNSLCFQGYQELKYPAVIQSPGARPSQQYQEPAHFLFSHWFQQRKGTDFAPIIIPNNILKNVPQSFNYSFLYSQYNDNKKEG